MYLIAAAFALWGVWALKDLLVVSKQQVEDYPGLDPSKFGVWKSAEEKSAMYHLACCLGGAFLVVIAGVATAAFEFASEVRGGTILLVGALTLGVGYPLRRRAAARQAVLHCCAV